MSNTTPTIEQIIHRMQVFKTRLLTLKQNPIAKMNEILFYEKEIALMEAEIAVDDLVCSVFDEPRKTPWKVRTDSWQTVEELCREEKVIFMDVKWSWKRLRFMWYVEYFEKRKSCYT